MFKKEEIQKLRALSLRIYGRPIVAIIYEGERLRVCVNEYGN